MWWSTKKKKSDFRCGFRWAEAASAGYIRHARRPVMKGLWITNALTGIQPAKIYSLFYKLLAAGPKLRGLPRRFRKMSFQIQPPIVAVLDPAPVECNRELDALIAIFVESRVASTCCTQLVTWIVNVVFCFLAKAWDFVAAQHFSLL